jgi:RNA polymerase sigma factor for flagellar operon FliA
MPPLPPNRRTSSEQALALWAEYRETDDRTIRDRLVLTFAPLVKYIVYKKVREMPAYVELEDLISCGLEALIHSIERFDPAKGATLEQYAWTRIHGAVLDELRRQDWAPRSVRRWERDIQRASDAFTTLHRRHPSTEELADALGIDAPTLRRKRDAIARSDVTSLNSLVQHEEDATIERVDTIASADHRLDPEHAAGIADAKERFRAAFHTLSQREREVAVLMYAQNLKLNEVGSILGVTESRVCQIHAGLKRKLRASLDEDAELMQLVA